MKIKNKYNTLVLISILLITSSFIISYPINSADELWNYNFSRNLSNGLLPYKDFNIIVPHIIYEIPALFFKIFNPELMLFRLFTIILATSVFYLVYKIIFKLIKRKNISYLITIIITIFNMTLYYYEYNRFVILLALIMLYLEINYLEKNKLLSYNIKHDSIIGIILGLTILTKHTVGIIMLIAVVGYKFLIITNKDDFKIYFKIFITRLFIALIPIILYLLYLNNLGIINEFIDYTVYGIKTFSNKLPFNTMITEQDNYLLKMINIILIYIIPITIIILFIKGIKRKNRTKNNEYNIILFTYAITTYSLFFPLSDLIHYQSASTITFIALIYNLFNLKIIEIIKVNIPNKIITISIFIFISIFSLNQYKTYFNSNKTDLNNYKNISINEDFENHIISVNNYIKEKTTEGYNVYILDFRAATHMIALNRYNKNYDMFNKGNFGSKGEAEIINRLEEEKNSLYLIANNYTLTIYPNQQNPKEVREYLQVNFKKIDEIKFYDVYQKY